MIFFDGHFIDVVCSFFDGHFIDVVCSLRLTLVFPSLSS